MGTQARHPWHGFAFPHILTGELNHATLDTALGGATTLHGAAVTWKPYRLRPPVPQQEHTCRPRRGCGGVQAVAALRTGCSWKLARLPTCCRLCRPQVVEVPLKVAQTAAVMEVLHSALGVVRSPVMITGGTTVPLGGPMDAETREQYSSVSCLCSTENLSLLRR